MSREDAESSHLSERDRKRKRDKRDAKDKLEEMVGPKEVGREGMLEKKRARREADRSFREKGDDGFEADDSTLMGGGDSFQERCAPLLLLTAQVLKMSARAQHRTPRCCAKANG